MSALVRDLVEGAYLRSSINDAGKLAGDAELIAHLNRVYQRVWALVARARPDEFAASVGLTLGGLPPVVTLPADLVAVLHVRERASGKPVTLAPLHERARGWHLAPCVYQQGRQLVSRNQSGDPRAGVTLDVAHLDAPAALLALTDALDTRWPARLAQLLVDALALYLSVKDAGRPAGEHQKLLAEVAGNAGALAAEYGLPPHALEWMHAPVERAQEATG